MPEPVGPGRIEPFAVHQRGDGEVGDANPMLAISDALRDREVEAVIIATLPAGVSRWLKLSLPERVARRVDVPVDHVVITPADA